MRLSLRAERELLRYLVPRMGDIWHMKEQHVFSTKSPDKRRDSFAGHFADKVQLVLAQRLEIPVP
ncbi:MAG: hypothetical protein JNL39_12250 [Opitutaceae bacterium]|nr:hypothetical protein [Opitutaceae bacterium]